MSQPTLIALYPVQISPFARRRFFKKSPDFFHDAPPIARAFGISGRRRPLMSNSFQLRQQLDLTKNLVLYKHPTAGFLALIEWNLRNIPRVVQSDLLNPNREATRSLLTQLNLSTRETLTTRTISGAVTDSSSSTKWDGLHLSISSKERQFVVDQSFARLLMAVGIERLILDRASEFVGSSIRLNFSARQHLASISGWISNLAIEDARLWEIYDGARKNLRFDQRSKELTASLETYIKSQGQAQISGIATSALGMAMASTGVTWGWSAEAFVSGSLVMGIMVWFLGRWTR